jgi:hypothetical protein
MGSDRLQNGTLHVRRLKQRARRLLQREQEPQPSAPVVRLSLSGDRDMPKGPVIGMMSHLPATLRAKP